MNPIMVYKFSFKEKQIKTSNQGLEGYSRDPGFDQNTVRDSGKRKIS